MSVVLAVDFGTSFTAAAVRVDGRVEAVGVGGAHRPLMPSCVLLDRQDGRLVVGRAALNRAAIDPAALVRTPKRLVGRTHALVAGQRVEVRRLIAAVLEAAYRGAQQSTPSIDSVVLTHPAAWGEDRRQLLRDAARDAGIGEVQLVPEPVAAAIHLSHGQAQPGQTFAVFDLGGGTFDACVLRATDATSFEILAQDGIDPCGGEDFDNIVYQHVLGRLTDTALAAELRDPDPDDHSALQSAALRAEVTKAKEILSEEQSTVIFVSGSTQRITLTRSELETRLAHSINRCVDTMAATITQAGLEPSQLTALHLTGGSSRIPLVTNTCWQTLNTNKPASTPIGTDPKLAVALGATQTHTTNTPPAQQHATSAHTDRTGAGKPGLDVEASATISAQEARLGTTREMAPVGSGPWLEIDIPAGVSEGTLIRFKGRGEPDTGGTERGDLYVTVHIEDDETIAAHRTEAQSEMADELAVKATRSSTISAGMDPAEHEQETVIKTTRSSTIHFTTTAAFADGRPLGNHFAPGILTLTSRRLIWTKFRSKTPRVDLALNMIANVDAGQTALVMYLHDDTFFAINVNAWTTRAWVTAIEEAVEAARVRRHIR